MSPRSRLACTEHTKSPAPKKGSGLSIETSRILALVTDGGYNISSDASCNLTVPTSRTNTDPRLDPLGLSDNGGPTKTISLQTTSPAVNAIPPSVNGCDTEINTDQRGMNRPQGPACDVGAFELVAQASPPDKD